MTTLTIPTATRNAIANAAVDLIDGGTGAGYIEIRDGAVVLATCVMSDPAFGNAATGVAAASAISDEDSAVASGTADNFKVYDSAATEIMSGDVGTAAATMIMPSVNITIGEPVSVTSFSVTAPAS